MKSNIYIQYLLELDTCGYVEPPNPRWDLTYAEKIDLVRNHRLRWNYPENVRPTAFELHCGEFEIIQKFAGGIYVHRVVCDGFNRRLCFHQLPSPNRNQGYKHWILSDLEVDICDFATDPEQDLLVLLEDTRREQNEEAYRLHLRTMSAGQPHPMAHACSSVAAHLPSSRLSPAKTFDIDILGRSLAIIFRSIRSDIASCIIIWNWTTGEELSVSVYLRVLFGKLIESNHLQRMSTVGGWHASFALLAENYFVLPRFSRPLYEENIASDDEFGFLDVYRFDAHGNSSTIPTCAASFALPLLELKDLLPFARIRCAPAGATSTSQSSPKVFCSSPKNRMLHLSIYTAPLASPRAHTFAGTLHVPVTILFDTLPKLQQLESQQSECNAIPWANWAEKTSFTTSSFRASSTSDLFGQRRAGFKRIRGHQVLQYKKVSILDFDQQRLKYRDTFGALGSEARNSGAGIGSSDVSRMLWEAFCTGAGCAKGEHIEQSIMLDEAVDESSPVVIDDEHGECMRVPYAVSRFTDYHDALVTHSDHIKG